MVSLGAQLLSLYKSTFDNTLATGLARHLKTFSDSAQREHVKAQAKRDANNRVNELLATFNPRQKQGFGKRVGQKYLDAWVKELGVWLARDHMNLRGPDLIEAVKTVAKTDAAEKSAELRPKVVALSVKLTDAETDSLSRGTIPNSFFSHQDGHMLNNSRIDDLLSFIKRNKDIGLMNKLARSYSYKLESLLTVIDDDLKKVSIPFTIKNKKEKILDTLLASTTQDALKELDVFDAVAFLDLPKDLEGVPDVKDRIDVRRDELKAAKAQNKVDISHFLKYVFAEFFNNHISLEQAVSVTSKFQALVRYYADIAQENSYGTDVIEKSWVPKEDSEF